MDNFCSLLLFLLQSFKIIVIFAMQDILKSLVGIKDRMHFVPWCLPRHDIMESVYPRCFLTVGNSRKISFRSQGFSNGRCPLDMYIYICL